ncbi:MAG: hypothetical protein JOY70_06170 [Acidisphaera sp.]|nr:hypothetical protein [Acidisphaera sp.]
MPAQQPHTEESVAHSEGQQNTGNHHRPDAPDAGGADRFGGTRTGAENVERRQEKPVEPERDTSELHPIEPERDERNRI